MTDIFRVNDTIFSDNSCTLLIDLDPYNGFKALDFEDSIEAPVQYGTRRDGRPLGTPSGKYVPGMAKLTLLRDSADRFTSYLSVKGALSIGDARFNLTLQVFEPIPSGVGSPLLITMLETCRVLKIKETAGEALTTEFDIQPLQLTRNNKRLWSVVRGPL